MAQNKIVITPDTTTVTVSSVGLNGPAGTDGSVTFPYTGSALITGSLDITGSITGPDYIDFAIGVDAPYAEGRLFYDQVNGALAFYNNEADITLQIGQEFYKKVTNRSGETITNGTPVFISGSQGDLSKIFPAISKNIYSNSFDPSANSIIGLATHDIEDNSSGFVTEKGVVRGIDTRDFEAGDRLYVQTGSSDFRNTPPPFPYSVIEVGTVGRSTVNGSIEVQPISSIVSENISGIINIELEVQSNESITIPKGTPVHINNTVSGTGPISLVNIAKADSASLMPATYVTEEEITSGSIGTALSIGYIPKIDTSGLNVGDTLYVSGEGGFTTAKPTGSCFIQNLGVVVQSDATDGSAFIYGSGRSNDLPNLQEGYHWVGNSDGVPTAMPTYIDTEISSAQILDLHNTPVELIPAQGASTVILVGTMVAKYTFGTTAYSQSGNNNISTFVRYPVGGGTTAAQGFFNLDTTQDRYQISPADLRIDTTEAIANNEVNLTVSSPITGGDGTIKIRTYYSVLPSTF